MIIMKNYHSDIIYQIFLIRYDKKISV